MKLKQIKLICGTQNRVVVEAFPEEEKTESGIIIAPSSDTRKKPIKGKVLFVSTVDVNGAKPMVKKGDIILYTKGMGTEVTIEKKDYLIMFESSFFAIVV